MVNNLKNNPLTPFILAMVTGDRQERNINKITRDKAYTYLKDAVDAVRDCGQYVFWRNEQRLKGYISQYRKRWTKAKDTGNNAVTEEEASYNLM
ncbi:MAG: hypothetical protein AB7W47_04180 [Calditrichaceae bacterium]